MRRGSGRTASRQEILNDANCKAMIVEMIEEQIDSAVSRFLNPDYVAESFREFVSNRLGVEFEDGEFKNISDFNSAEQVARDKGASIHPDRDSGGDGREPQHRGRSEGLKWQEMTRLVNAKYGLKLKDAELKKIDRENLPQFLLEHASRSLNEVDLSRPRFLDRAWGVSSLCDWANTKFRLELIPKDFGTKDESEARALILEKSAAYTGKKRSSSRSRSR